LIGTDQDEVRPKFDSLAIMGVSNSFERNTETYSCVFKANHEVFIGAKCKQGELGTEFLVDISAR
jgi:hypothetical protein